MDMAFREFSTCIPFCANGISLKYMILAFIKSMTFKAGLSLYL